MKKYHDVLIEQFVKEKRPKILVMPRFLAYLAVLTLTLLTGIITLYFATEYMIIITAFVLIVLVFASTPFRKKRCIEYEYSFLGGDIKISKIINKSKRKPMLSFTCQDIQQMSRKYDINRGKSSNNFNSVMDTSSSDESEGRWYLIISGTAGGRVLLVIEPNERLLGALLEYVPRAKVDN